MYVRAYEFEPNVLINLYIHRKKIGDCLLFKNEMFCFNTIENIFCLNGSVELFEK